MENQHENMDNGVLVYFPGNDDDDDNDGDEDDTTHLLTFLEIRKYGQWCRLLIEF